MSERSAGDVQYHCYVPQMIPCPNCVPCAEHLEKGPRINVRNRYYRVFKDGTRKELTRDEYDKRLIN